MRLQSIELFGFKSFPDRTVLNFNRGVTAVVGPNGSGKSNIADAVRWVLGELSSKSMRGTKMEDVIFNGTDKRKPMNCAEVSLTIDNTDPDNRVNIDSDEVTVTRRYYRGGDSEYLINRKPVRLRDINELFMNTGIGRDGYSIIGQGRASEIISQKSEERRHVFEEAAGVSKYRYQRAECEKKLAVVDENLTRIADITSEIGSRLEPLRKEAEKAEKYLELFNLKKSVDISLWLFDIEQIRKKQAESEVDFAKSKAQLDEADRTLAALEEESEKLFSSSQENKLQYEQHERKIGDYTKRRYELEASLKLLENDAEHLKTQMAQHEAERKLRIQGREEAQVRSLSSEDKLRRMKAACEELEQSHAEATKELNEIQERLDRLGDEYEASERSIQSASGDENEYRLQLSALEGADRSTFERREALEKEQGEIDGRLALVTARLEKSAKSVADYQAAVDKLHESIAAFEEEQKKAQEAVVRLGDQAAQLRLAISSDKQRLETLRRMEELFEGYGQSVKNVMLASDTERLKGIIGPVSRVLNVPSAYALALETALGANIQNIIVEDEEAAKAAISHLARTNGGRATFYPLTSVRSAPFNVNQKELSSCEGYVGIASELAEYDRRYAEIIGSMLGRTVVFDTLDHATVMAKRFGYRVRAVTLDGQIINTGGSFTGGSSRRESGMLTRAAEIEKIGASIGESEKKLEKLTAEKNASEERFRAHDRELSSQRNRLTLLSSLMNAENTQYQVLAAQRDGDAKRREAIDSEMKRMDVQNREALELRDKLQKNLEKASELLTSERAHLGEIDAERGDWKKKHERKMAEINTLLVSLTAQRKDCEAAEETLRLNTAALETLDGQIARSEDKIREVSLGILHLREESENRSQEIQALDADIQALDRERSELLVSGRELEQSSEKLRRNIRELNRERDVYFRNYSQLESLLNAQKAEYEKLNGRLMENYELTYEAAKEQGYPAADEASRPRLTAQANEYRGKLRALGSVNTASIAEYKENKERYDSLMEQQNDLNDSRVRLSGILHRLENEMKNRFTKSIDEINLHFREVFRELFDGGEAEIAISDPNNVLECGI